MKGLSMTTSSVPAGEVGTGRSAEPVDQRMRSTRTPAGDRHVTFPTVAASEAGRSPLRAASSASACASSPTPSILAPAFAPEINKSPMRFTHSVRLLAPDPEPPSRCAIAGSYSDERGLGVPTTGRLIEIDFANELIEHRGDSRYPAHSRQAPALDDNSHLSAESFDRVGKVGGAASPGIVVLAGQGEKGGADRAQVRRIGCKQGELDCLVGAGAQAFEEGKRRPAIGSAAHSAATRSLSSVLTCSHL